jgi:hypothetical protein
VSAELDRAVCELQAAQAAVRQEVAAFGYAQRALVQREALCAATVAHLRLREEWVAQAAGRGC